MLYMVGLLYALQELELEEWWELYTEEGEYPTLMSGTWEEWHPEILN